MPIHLHIISDCFLTTAIKLNSYDKYYRGKTENIYSVALYRKRLPIPRLQFWLLIHPRPQLFPWETSTYLHRLCIRISISLETSTSYSFWRMFYCYIPFPPSFLSLTKPWFWLEWPCGQLLVSDQSWQSKPGMSSRTLCNDGNALYTQLSNKVASCRTRQLST